MKQKEIREREMILEAFEGLQQYVREGYLEAVPAKGEVYITNAAMHCLAGNLDAIEDIEAIKEAMGTDDYDVIRKDAKYGATLLKNMKQITKNIECIAILLRGWCLWLNAHNEGFKRYIEEVGEHDGTLVPEVEADVLHLRARDIVRDIKRRTVAVHIVEDEMPHHLKLTILVRPHRRWWWPFVETDSFKYIYY